MLHLSDLGDILLKASNQNTIRLSCPCIFNVLHPSVKSILESIDVDLSLIEGCFKYYEDSDNTILVLYGNLNVDFKMVHDATQKNIFIISFGYLSSIEEPKELIKTMKDIFRLILFENNIQYHNINIVRDPKIIDLFHKNLPDRIWLEAIYSIWCLSENNTILEDVQTDKFSYDDLLKMVKTIKLNHKSENAF
jgi:hypothetical protein